MANETPGPGTFYDAQGRPYSYVHGANGYTNRRIYTSPVAYGGQAPPDETGILHHGPEWNQNTGQWETPWDWGNIGNIGVGSLLTAGAVNTFFPGGPLPAGDPGGLPAYNPVPGVPGATVPGVGNIPLPPGLPTGGPPLPSGPIPGAPTTPGTGPTSPIPNRPGTSGIDWRSLLPNSPQEVLDLLERVATGAGGAADAMANNRGSKFAGQIDYDRNQIERDRDFWLAQTDQAKLTSSLNIDREREGREGRGDAWKRLGQAQRVLNPVQYDAGPYGPKPRTVSALERQGADALTQEVMARLTGGNPIPVPNVPVPEKTKFVADLDELDASGYERFLGGLSVFGASPRIPRVVR